ncbi:unnamed protein product, partial [Meganyctiphanes norvegica]
IYFTKWCRNYMVRRKKVVENVSYSKLGSLLYILYVNTISVSDQYKLLWHAYYIALIVSGPSPNTTLDTLSTNIKSCRQWFIFYQHSLHLGKTESILFRSKRK